MRSNGRTALVTGATSGLGHELAALLAKAGWTVHVHGRSAGRAAEATARLKARLPEADLRAAAGDLGTLAGVWALADALAGEKLDLLVNNAGASFADCALTADGIERTVAVNHFAPVLLTRALADRLAPGALVLTVSSSSITYVPVAAEEVDVRGLFLEAGYTQLRGYALSKLLNLAAMPALARQTGLAVVMFDPGGIQTDFAEKGGDAAFVAMTKAHWDAMETPAAVAAKAMALIDQAPDLIAGATYHNGAVIGLSDLAGQPAFQDRILNETLAVAANASVAN